MWTAGIERSINLSPAHWAWAVRCVRIRSSRNTKAAAIWRTPATGRVKRLGDRDRGCV